MGDAAPLRIALIASSFAPHVGGVEEHVAQIAKELARRGDRVEVWTVDRGVRPEIVFGHGVEVRYLPTPLPARSFGDLWRFLLRGPGAWLQWSRAYRELRPDLLHVHCFGPNGLYALALHRRFGVPLFVTSHGETNGDDASVFDRSALLRRGLRAALHRAVVTTAPTEFVLKDLRERFGLHGGVVVHNGVDRDVVPAGGTPSAPYLAAVGRLGRMKGFDLLIDAFATAREQGMIGSAIRLLIAGDGPESEALLARIRTNGLEETARLLGRLEPSQVASLIAGAEALVVPSRSEAFGIVALEAWREGTALVMTSRGGAAEFMRHEVDALLVDPVDPAALTDAVARVVSDAALRERLATAGRRRVGSFAWADVAERYRGLYRGGVHEDRQ